MKYIRTKDGRIIDTTKKSVSLGYHPVEADTIPELCDRVVVKDFNVKEPRVYKANKYNWKEIANTLFNIRKVEWVKFAIWTNEGLIYKAEMNEKGDLKLL